MIISREHYWENEAVAEIFSPKKVSTEEKMDINLAEWKEMKNEAGGCKVLDSPHDKSFIIFS